VLAAYGDRKVLFDEHRQKGIIGPFAPLDIVSTRASGTIYSGF
jgi:hypothetical protein